MGAIPFPVEAGSPGIIATPLVEVTNPFSVTSAAQATGIPVSQRIIYDLFHIVKGNIVEITPQSQLSGTSSIKGLLKGVMRERSDLDIIIRIYIAIIMSEMICGVILLSPYK